MAMNELTPFDAVIPVHPKDESTLHYCLLGLRANTKGLQNIYLVSKDEPEDCEGCIWVPESSFPFSVTDISGGRAGWYVQQLVKLYAFRVIGGILPHVLLLDADTVICRPVEFFDQGKICLDWCETIYPPYFAHGFAVLGHTFVYDPTKSGIADHMMVHHPVMENLLQTIEQRLEKPAWKALLEAVVEREGSGMSEYELYFNYALTWYADNYVLRRLVRKWGASLGELQRDSATNDMISFHSWYSLEHSSRNQTESAKTAVTEEGETGSAAQ